MIDNEQSGSLETAKDAGQGPGGVVKRWLVELALADKEEKEWRKQAEQTINIARQAEKVDSQGVKKKNTFNILWANTETLRPAIYNSTPDADVRRRYRDADPTGKAAANVLERCLDYSIDSYDFDDVMLDAVDDYLLPGRAVTRVRYVPTFAAAKPMQPAADEEVNDGAEPEVAEPNPPQAGGNSVSAADGTDSEGSDEVVYEEVQCEHVHWDDFRRGPG